VCTTTQSLVVEVANSGAVGSVTVPLSSTSSSDSTQGFDLLDSSVIGVAEGTPIEVLTLHVGSDVTAVKASFADGTSDQMQVASGWAVLVDDGSSPLPATVQALDSSGNRVASASVTSDSALAQPRPCVIPVDILPLAGTASPGATTGSK
jgi:hypothetical protein